MAETKVVKFEEEESLENPFFAYIDKMSDVGSVRELIGNAFGDGVSPWDLPKDPEKLKQVLIEAIDYAVSRKAAVEVKAE